MAAEQDFENEKEIARLESERRKYAEYRLAPRWVIESAYYGATMWEHELPEYARWNKDTDWGKSGYFDSPLELIAAINECEFKYKPYTKEDEPEFTINSDNYLVIYSSKEHGIALAGAYDKNSNFFVDVYLSKSQRRYILQEVIAHYQERIDNKYKDTMKLHKINHQFQQLLKELN